MAYKHLDSEFRNSWQEFTLKDGIVLDSRQINWRDVAWDRVVKIVVKIKGKVHKFDFTEEEGFIGYMNLRWGGQEWINGVKKKIDVWTVGWTDGVTCFLNDIQFKTGEFIKSYTMPIKELRQHIHPAILNKIS